LAASTPVLSSYEAGRDGFWLHRYLHSQGLHNLILDSASIEVKRRKRRAKTDRQALRTSADAAVEQVRQLLQLRGIGPTSAWRYVFEFFAWRNFRNRRQGGALAGLTPAPHQSGDAAPERGISKAGNRYVQALAVELAWAWLQHQPTRQLSCW
jgi:transposase